MENSENNTTNLPEDFVNKYKETSQEDLMAKLYKAEHKIVETKKEAKEVKKTNIVTDGLDVNKLKEEVISEFKRDSFYGSNEVSDQAQNQIEAMVSTGLFTREDAFNLVSTEENKKKENIAKTNAMSAPVGGTGGKATYTVDEITNLSDKEYSSIMEKVEKGEITLAQ